MVFALVAMLAMTLVVTGEGIAMLHAGEPGQVAAPNPESYLPSGDIWQILDLAALAPFPGYAFAQSPPDSTPPTFVSSELDGTTEVLTITFSEAIDAANVVPAKIHVRASGNYTHGVTLTAGELGTVADGATISFNLNTTRLAAVVGLAAPELTIEPGAVRDVSGNLIIGTFEASTATFVDSFSVLPQSSGPQGMAFSSDGGKMFVVGNVVDNVDEYELSTPFDVSTAVNVSAISVQLQENRPTGIAFSNDGAKMFVIGTRGVDVNEYDLSTPFDVSTAVNVTATSVSAREGSPQGMAFSSDGTRMFVVGWDANDVNEYKMSTPFDTSNATFVGSFPISEHERLPTGIAFSSDGAKMFVIGIGKKSVNEYKMFTPFDTSNVTFVDATSISDQETYPTGIAFSNDGAKMFVIGNTGKDVNEYDLRSVYPIAVRNNLPMSVQVVGGNQTVGEGDTVTLYSSTKNPDGDPITYTWSQTDPAAPLITFANASMPSTTFVAPSVTEDTTFTITLTIHDGTQYATDALNVTVKETGAAFITTWTTTNRDPIITLPMEGTYSILWGNGTYSENINGTISSKYGAAGDYTVVMLGDGLEYIRLHGDAANARQLKSIDQWGDTKWTTMDRAFRGANSMTYNATDAPDLSRVTNMTSMFHGTPAFNGDLSSWDVSSVTDMTNVFRDATSFNGDLSSWDVSSVTDMTNVFRDATSFNGDLFSWDVSSVTYMTNVFRDATSFNQTLSSWDVSSVTDMSAMFVGATSFNQSLSAWDVSSVTDMSSMFVGAISFNRPLSAWDVSSVTYMSAMFADATSFNQPLSSWDVSSVRVMGYMFDDADSFDQNLGAWYVVPADTVFYTGDTSLGVTTISTQNGYLRSQYPDYGIGSNEDPALFNMTGPTLTFINTPTAGVSYKANVTASGASVFESDNNWRMLDITVRGGTNNAPTAEAGRDLNVDEGSSVTLQGSGSDPDSDRITYAWSQYPDTPVVTFDNISSAAPLVTAPSVAANTTITLTLTVRDDDDTSTRDTMVLTIQDVPLANQAPSADAGNDRQVDEGGSITLQGSGSDTDGNDSDLTYSWSQSPATPVISFDNRTSATPEITAPSVTAETEITLTLRVDDGTDHTTDTMVLTIQDVPPVNQAPSADAGNDRQVDEGGSITLQGSGSDTDGNDSDLTYSWSQSPLSPVVSFDNRTSATPEITAPSVTAETEITLTLRVDDGTDHTTDTMVLTIQDVPLANQAPSADAGNDRQVDEGGSITLQGSGSDTDGNDSDLTYSWSQSPLSPVVSFDNRTSATPEITAPSVTAETEITLTLRVDDGTDHTTDTMVLTIQDVPPVNQAPSADAGNDRQVDEGGSITLQGSGSDTDGNDSDLTYSWSQSPLSPVVSFDNRTSATPEITAPSVTAETEITLTLRVDDGTDHTTDTMVLTIQDVPLANQAPSADAGNDRQVDEGGSITLQGSGSDTDGNDSDLTYSWSQSPLSPVVSFDNRTSATPEITAPSVTAETEITLTLRVDDGTDHTTDTMVLTIQDVPPVNQAPSADAGNDRQVDEGGSITLQGSGSDTDGNDSDLTYLWSQSPLSPVVSFDNQNSATPEITAPSVTAETEITLTLRVDDGTDHTTDTMVLTINNINNQPVADAGGNRSVNEGAPITLQGSGSDDDGDDLTYSWSQDSRLSFDNSSSATPTVTASAVTANTTITLTLTVDDGTSSGEDTMVLTILDVTTATVNVGPDQTVKEGATVSMPWTASGPDGDSLTYSWSQSPLSPVISLNSSDSPPTTFTAPTVDADTAFTFTLAVTADQHTVEDSLTITVKNNRPPIIENVPEDSKVNEGVPVTLTVTARDPDKDPLTYEWTIVSGPAPTDLTGDNTKSLQFTAPGVTSDEEIVFRLTVTDDAGESVDDTVMITVRNVPITVSSATYNPGSGTLLITFNQDIDTVDYSRLHVRSADSDTGGITLSSVVTEPTFSDRTITAVLDSDMRETYADLTSPQLVVEDGAVTDTDGDQTMNVPDQPIRDASSRKKSSSSPPAVHLSALIQTRTVDIPPHIAEQVASHDASDPLEPLMPDGTFDFPLVINGYGYLLDDVTNTLVPQILTVGDDDPTIITFTVYTQKDLAHFTLYLNLSDENTDYANSDTYITYKNDDGTTGVTDPHGYIGSATVTVTQEDDQIPEKKTVQITIEFGEEPMGPTNMVAYMWNTDRKALFVKIIDAIEVVAALLEPVMQAADPEPIVPDSEMPVDSEPVAPSFESVAADTGPVSPDALWPADNYDDAQDLILIRMWSGFESESITDAQLLDLLGLEDYQGIDLPDWMMTDLGVLVAKGAVTVDEFMLALQYVLENS